MPGRSHNLRLQPTGVPVRRLVAFSRAIHLLLQSIPCMRITAGRGNSSEPNERPHQENVRLWLAPGATAAIRIFPALAILSERGTVPTFGHFRRNVGDSSEPEVRRNYGGWPGRRRSRGIVSDNEAAKEESLPILPLAKCSRRYDTLVGPTCGIAWVKVR
jgi:hypothetical protein